MDELPGLPGTYIVVLYAARKKSVCVGMRGIFEFVRGYYAYVGSAFGPGGMRSRIKRHLALMKPKHWHIDYLRAETIVREIWFTRHPVSLEHEWARALHASPEACRPISGFGCSDCTCGAHLFHFTTRPDPLVLSSGVKIERLRIGRGSNHPVTMETIARGC